MVTVSYQCNSRMYTFQGVQIYPQNGRVTGKRLIQGAFVGACPAGLELTCEYILVEITISGNLQNANPQEREFWDIGPFRGDHLREILSRNDDAARMVSELEPGDTPAPGVYMAIEPVYRRISENLLKSMTLYERIELIYQICLGLKDLYGHCIGGQYVLAHRDMKLPNAMIQPGTDKFTVRIIDLASIYFDGGNSTLRRVPLSQENAAWELFIDPERVGAVIPGGHNGKGIRLPGITGKLDVFVLGGILGQLFSVGNVNPIFNFIQSTWKAHMPVNGSNLTPKEWEKAVMTVSKMLDELYRSTLSSYPDTQAGNWLEVALKDEFVWDRELLGPLYSQVWVLFRKMIPINPELRIPIEEVCDTLNKMRLWLRREGRAQLSAHASLYLPAAPVVSSPEPQPGPDPLFTSARQVAEPKEPEEPEEPEATQEKLAHAYILIDTRSLGSDRLRYEQALLECERGLRRRAAAHGCSGVCMDTIFFSATPRDTQAYLLKSIYAQSYESCDLLLEDMDRHAPLGSSGYSSLVAALWVVLNAPAPDELLPELHIFLPDTNMPQLSRKGMGVDGLCDRLRDTLNLTIFCHGPEDLPGEWFDRLEPLPERYDPFSTGGAADDPDYSQPSGICTDRSGWYILDGERKIFVGRRR